VYAKPIDKKIIMHGLGSNISINGAIMSLMAMASLACTIPYLGLIGWMAGVASTFKARGSSGIGGVVLGSTIYWAYNFPIVVASIYGIILLSSPLWWKWSVNLFGDVDIKRYKILGIKMHPIFYLSGRWEIWKQAYKSLYQKYAHKWFGIGNGAFKFAFPVIEMHERGRPPQAGDQCFIFLHNDILQWWIEGGKFGFLLFIASLAELFCLGYRDPFFMGMISCLIVNSFAYFSFSMMPERVLMMMAIKRLVS
jgi:O-antigen ligase